MRNLKKFLALALAMVMTLSVMSVASAKTYSDSESITAKYAEAVDVLSGLKVFEGYEDGTFSPKGNITRAEVAAIIYRVATGDVEGTNKDLYADYNKFDDVTSERWFAGYVNYCANAVYIKGVGNNKFDPNGNVTGYQVLAMILRAVGYDQNNEWTGSGWETKVASTARELGITDTVSEVKLGEAATREVVAELLFRTITLAPKVSYTPALGYSQYTSLNSTTKNPTLGVDVFGLSCSDTKDMDVWGRPGYEWTATKTAAKGVVASYTQTPVASYTVKVDECDIIKDLGLTKNAAVEAGYIDGVVSAVDDNATLEALATTKYVGAQGRLTEVYDMGKDGYRVVEINTYLGKVTKTTAATVDKNNHPVAATATVEVYVDNTTTPTDTLTTDKYAVGDYVLVNLVPTFSNSGVTKIAIQDTQNAEIVSGGKVTAWTNAAGLTPSTTTVGTTVYNDADKFVLNYRNTTKAFSVVKDTYGNIIGLVEVATNYLVISAIEWKQGSTVNSGSALANVVLADGTALNNVTVSKVNNIAVSNKTDSYGNREQAIVSDHAYNNGTINTAAQGQTATYTNGYYGHIFTYTVDANGAYELNDHGKITLTNGDYNSDSHTAVTGIVDALNATVKNSTATINSSTNQVVGTSTTVYLVQLKNQDTYTAYVGKDAVPSGTADKMCALLNASNYATLVVLTGYELDSNTFTAFITDEVQDVFNNPLGNGYYVYKVGETTPTVVYEPAGTTYLTGIFANTGLYNITVDDNGVIQSNIKRELSDLSLTSSGAAADKPLSDGNTYTRLAIRVPEDHTSIQTYRYGSLVAANNALGYTLTAGTAYADYNINSDTVVIKVHKTDLTGTATLSVGSVNDLVTNAVVFVGAQTSGTVKNAKVVYVFDSDYVDTTVTPDYSGAISLIYGNSHVSTQIAVNQDAYLTVEDAVAHVQTLDCRGEAGIAIKVDTTKVIPANNTTYPGAAVVFTSSTEATSTNFATQVAAGLAKVTANNSSDDYVNVHAVTANNVIVIRFNVQGTVGAYAYYAFQVTNNG